MSFPAVPSKIGGISGIKGDAIRIAVTTLTSAVAQNMAGLFQGETFGDALANLYRNLKSPETWLVPLVNHAFGKYLDVSQPAGPAGKGLPEGSGTRMEPVKKPVKIPKKPALAVAVALMFGPAAHTVDLHAKKPTIT